MDVTFIGSSYDNNGIIMQIVTIGCPIKNRDKIDDLEHHISYLFFSGKPCIKSPSSNRIGSRYPTILTDGLRSFLQLVTVISSTFDVLNTR